MSASEIPSSPAPTVEPNPAELNPVELNPAEPTPAPTIQNSFITSPTMDDVQSQPQIRSYGDSSYRWNRENYSRQRRYIDIWSFVLKLMAAQWAFNKSWSYPSGMTDTAKAVVLDESRPISDRICRGTLEAAG